jgi:hypothetical protein
MNIVGILTSVALFSISTYSSGQGIYRCTVNGKTIFSDKACPPDGVNAQASPHVQVTPTDKAATVTTDYSTPYGEWRGQTQFQISSKGQHVVEAHSVVPMTIAIDSHGKVTGASPENGCRLLGVAAPGLPQTILHMDVSLSGCNYVRYNRRFSGTLALYGSNKHVQLRLSSMVPLQSQHFDIKATMRR